MTDFFSISAIEEKLKLSFLNKDLLQLAFVHRSFWNENQALFPHHNERLEFLGDSVLGLIVAHHLYQNYPHLDEGALSTLRSQLVDAPACIHYVRQLEIDKYLLLGKGEQANQGKGRDSILADLFEALMGAIYLDAGFERAEQFFLAHFQTEVNKVISQPQRNWKAELQDYAQKNFQHPPVYEVISEEGPAHSKIFRVIVWIKGEKIGVGMGSSKKEAQANAARDAMNYIGDLLV